jgi:hypothetical protein
MGCAWGAEDATVVDGALSASWRACANIEAMEDTDGAGGASAAGLSVPPIPPEGPIAQGACAQRSGVAPGAYQAHTR